MYRIIPTQSHENRYNHSELAIISSAREKEKCCKKHVFA